jgi:hypothetical protein
MNEKEFNEQYERAEQELKQSLKEIESFSKKDIENFLYICRAINQYIARISIAEQIILNNQKSDNQIIKDLLENLNQYLKIESIEYFNIQYYDSYISEMQSKALKFDKQSFKAQILE